MRNKFQLAFSRIHNLPPMIKGCLDRAIRNQKPARPVSTNLSFRTYNQLKAQGIMS